jgi:filamentous hemagglutinin family protein
MNKHRHFNWMFALTAGIMPVGAAYAVNTQIQTDNTLSGITALNVNAPGFATTYQITEANGKAAGNNLFYSFSNFNVGASDTAHFNLNSANLSNVVSRVTGGFESVIDGGLKMTNIGSSPAFFFINPAGITFGAGASVDVPGSFYASTASSLQFADGYRYNADGSNTSSLSSAAPESFGFLGDESGAINIDGATLKFKPGTDAALVGNSITIDSATITNSETIETGMTAAGVDLQLIATGAAPADIKLDVLPGQATAGDLTIQNAFIDVSGNGSGRIAVRAGDVIATDSALFADNRGDASMTENDGIDVRANSLDADHSFWTNVTYAAGNGGSVNVTIDQKLTLTDNAAISSNAWGKGNSGDMTIHAGQLEIDGESNTKATGISTGTVLNSSGNAGDLNVTVDGDLILVSGGKISSSTAGTGDAGTVMVNAGQVVIDNSEGNMRVTGITSNAQVGTGNAGAVAVTVDGLLSIVDGGVVSSSTAGTGDAGTVTIDAGQLEIDGKGSIGNTEFTGIASQAETGSSGEAGSVTVMADTLDIVNGGVIDSSTNGPGDAGQVTVTADALSIVNGGGITALTRAEGNAGTVTVDAGQLEIDGQGSQFAAGISSQAQKGSSGDAGSVTVTADTLNVNRGIIDSSTYGPSDAGQVTVTADALSIVNGGGITALTWAEGNAGTVTVDAGQLEIDGQGSQLVTGISSQTEGGSSGDAGSVTVTADVLSIVNGGSIDTSTFGAGNAGDVIVKADTLTIQGTGSIPLENLGQYYEIDNLFPSGIFSIASAGSSGQTGNITVTAGDEINLTAGAQISISNEATVADPSALQPTAINITTPSLYLIGSQIVADSGGNVDAGDIAINFEDSLYLDPSAISTVANAGNGGDIAINGGNIIYLQDSEIVTSVLGTSGNGGDIGIGANDLIMDSGFIQANTAAEGASGGLVDINVAALIPSGGLLYLGGDTPYPFQPYSGINVIQAAAPDGVSGTINVTNPQLNLSGTLANLTIPLIDPNALSRNMCTVGDDSTLLQTGKGGPRRRAKDALLATKF